MPQKPMKCYRGRSNFTKASEKCPRIVLPIHSSLLLYPYFIFWSSYIFYCYYSISQFSDKLEGLEETLVTAVELVDNAEPISAHPDKLRDQITENRAVMEDMEMRLTALQSVTEAADDILKQKGMDDEAAKG